MTMTKTRSKVHLIKVQEGSDLEFEGHLVGSISSRIRDRDRWTELRLYKTKGGSFIAEEVGCSVVEQEINLTEAEVCKSEADVIAFFGDGWLAKRFYDEVGIVAKTHVA